MRRDHFTPTVEHTDPDATALPTLAIRYDGPAGNLTARLATDGGLPDGEDLDAAFRRTEPGDAAEAVGVFALTRRLTGEFLLEVEAETGAVRSLVDAARNRDGSYRVRIERPGADDVVLEMKTLLVYDPGGNLLRKDSLIPSGVEL